MIRKILILIFVSILLAGCITSQPAETGTLQLTSSPAGAEIYLDNQYRGTTPGTITGVAPGSHTLEVRLKGYKSWKSAVTVPAGTSNFFASLTVLADSAAEPAITPDVTAEPEDVTVMASRDQIIIGDSITFSGVATGMDIVTLTLFGPGKYANGVFLNTVKPNADDDWTYLWNPGSSIKSGIYTIVAGNSRGTVSDRDEFTAIGDGVVTITPSSYAVGKGDTITLSGRSTTFAPSVSVVLFGPERYGGGVDLGTISVMADQTWSFRYTTDSTMPTGVYTVYASDIPKTAQGSSQFTIGYAS